MTTIATDGRSMAGDSQMTGGSQVLRFSPKVSRLADGRIVGACGPTTECIKLVRWISEGGDKPELSDEVCAIILNADGTVDWLDHKLETISGNLVPYAIGSGGDLALGAMLAGASPAQAVAYAASRDVHTGGEITVLAIEPQIKAAA
jgi:ATP-dependent protease HslVU (ClpYQ) peptidase subunit